MPADSYIKFKVINTAVWAVNMMNKKNVTKPHRDFQVSRLGCHDD